MPKETKDPTKETILQTSRLFVRNLAFSCTDAELAELFKPFGEISQVSVKFPEVFVLSLPRGLSNDDNVNRDIRPSGMLILRENR